LCVNFEGNIYLQWEIHQDLPYGTMADNEMRKMNIGVLQDDGVIFLWVTGQNPSLSPPPPNPVKVVCT
jgi:N6-adenosine-specific RNA methylase IME4